MQFIDESKIFIKSGDGGSGCCSFRREANVPMGGPDGGNGGKGGNVYAEAIDGLNTLVDYRYKRHFKAKNGEAGKGRDRFGASRPDIILKVPIGTIIYDDETNEQLADLVTLGQKILLAEGGDGGLGNAQFKSSVTQAPRKTTTGKPGLEKWIRLELKLLSDAGLIGMPNAGKSTFLSVVSRAKPKIADYPFTTLTPQLGVVYIDEKEFVLADIPGLIKGASQGHGLGDQFLRHVERCGVLIHLIDITDDAYIENYQSIRHELQAYSKNLAQKVEIVALNKCDVLQADEVTEKVTAFTHITGIKPNAISAVQQANIDSVLRETLKVIQHTSLDALDQQDETPYDPLG